MLHAGTASYCDHPKTFRDIDMLVREGPVRLISLDAGVPSCHDVCRLDSRRLISAVSPGSRSRSYLICECATPTTSPFTRPQDAPSDAQSTFQQAAVQMHRRTTSREVAREAKNFLGRAPAP